MEIAQKAASPTPFARFLFETGIRQTAIANAIGKTPALLSEIARGNTPGSEQTVIDILRYLSKVLRRRVTRGEVFGEATSVRGVARGRHKKAQVQQ